MNDQPTGERLGDEENTDPSVAPHNDKTPTARSGTNGHGAGDQTRREPLHTPTSHEDVPEAKGTPSMSMPAGRPAAPPSDGALASTPASRSTGGRRPAAVMVVLALIVGALIGAGVVAATQSNDNATKTGAGSTSSPTTAAAQESPSVGPAASPSTTVAVPAICMNLAEDAQAIVDLSTQAAEAARDLNASKLSSIVRNLDTAQQQLRKDTAACRAAQTGA